MGDEGEIDERGETGLTCETRGDVHVPLFRQNAHSSRVRRA